MNLCVGRGQSPAGGRHPGEVPWRAPLARKVGPVSLFLSDLLAEIADVRLHTDLPRATCTFGAPLPIPDHAETVTPADTWTRPRY
jgi:hypothetical protein